MVAQAPQPAALCGHVLRNDAIPRRYYKQILAVSEPIKRELIAQYGVPPSAISLLPNGATLSDFTPNLEVRTKTRASLAVSPNQHLLCMLVNELERKGVRQTLEAVSRLRHYDLKLLIVSRMPEAQVKQNGQALCLRGQADISLQRSRRTPLSLGERSVCSTYPVRGAWNLSLMEAHAAGLPIITTRLGQADLMISGRSGSLLEDPRNVEELTKAIENWVLRSDKEAMTAAALKCAAPYDWKLIVKRLESLLEAQQA